MKRNEIKCLAWLGLSALITSGCTHGTLRSTRIQLKSLPAAMAAEYAYVRQEKPACKMKVLETKSEFTRKQIELLVTGEGAATNRSIRLEYYDLPGKTNSPVILVLPMLGGGYGVERIFASYFASRGYAAVIVHRAKINKKEKGLEDLNPMLKEMVIDHRKVIDWLETQEDLDCARLGIFGVSMGGIKGALLIPLENRIQAAVLGLAGGDLPYILTHSTEPGLAKQREQVLREQKLTLQEAEKKLRAEITCDPMIYAPYVDPKKVLLVLARFDTVVPIEKGLELKKKMGNPEVIMLPSGHYTAAFSIPYIKQQSFEFYQKCFAEKGALRPKKTKFHQARSR